MTEQTVSAATVSAADVIEPDLLEILCCPKCKGDLAYDPPKAEMACESCQFYFPVVDGIPLIFPFDVKSAGEAMFDRHWDPEEMAEKYDQHVEGKASRTGMYIHRGETDGTMKILGSVSSDTRFLDAGCGTGRFFDVLPQDGFTVGIDASLNMLRVVRRKGRCKRLVCCELENLPFKDESFDLILSVRVIQHLKKQREAVAEMARACRPTGWVVLQLYNYVCIKGFFKWLRESPLGPVLNWPFSKLKSVYNPLGPWPVAYDKYNSPWQIKSWLRAEGLRIDKVRGAGLSFNKSPLGDFWVLPWLDKRAPKVLDWYLNLCLGFENRFGHIWPLSHVLEKFVIRAIK